MMHGQKNIKSLKEFSAVRTTFTSTLLEEFRNFSRVCKLIAVETLHFYTFQIPINGEL